MDPILEMLLREGLAGLAVAGVVALWVRQGGCREKLTGKIKDSHDALDRRMDEHEKAVHEYQLQTTATLATILEHIRNVDERLQAGDRRFERIEDKRPGGGGNIQA